jgi:hypothetical protein
LRFTIGDVLCVALRFAFFAFYPKPINSCFVFSCLDFIWSDSKNICYISHTFSI